MDLIFRNEKLTFPEARYSSTKQWYFRVVSVRYRFFNEIAETPRNVKSSVPLSSTFERGSNAASFGSSDKDKLAGCQRNSEGFQMFRAFREACTATRAFPDASDRQSVNLPKVLPENDNRRT